MVGRGQTGVTQPAANRPGFPELAGSAVQGVQYSGVVMAVASQARPGPARASVETAALAGGHSDTDPPSAVPAYIAVNNTIITGVILGSALHTCFY